MKVSAALTLGAALLAGLAACRTDGGAKATPTPKAREEEPVFTVKTTEYKFEAQPVFEGGLLTIVLDNRSGKEAHEAGMLRLDPDKKAADYVKAIGEKQPTAFAHPAGGPGPVPPGKTATYTGNLPEGDYIFVCRVPAPDNQEHLTKGMIYEIRLSGGTAASIPQTPATIGGKEFEFTGSETLKAGSQTVKVINEGRQPHNFGLVVLAPGKRAEDLRPYLVAPGSPLPPGPAPFTGLAGIVATLPAGDEATRTVELLPNTSYALICFVPDIDGTPHYAKGMMAQVDIK